jgi:hypothetical protein
MIYRHAAAAAALLASVASAHDPLPGTLVTTQLRCQGQLTIPDIFCLRRIELN